MYKKKILFLTGTRADYGKMKSLMKEVEKDKEFDCHIFVTGMHTLEDFGNTKNEIFKDGFKNIQVYMNQIIEEPMDLVLANTINGFSRYIKELKPDMIVVHGDRVEALAGAISGALNNLLVVHIEGGEVSGTIDESIRHAISKLAHIHMVTNEKAKKRLIQLGELEKNIYIIGSPDIDYILKETELDFNEIKNRYEIKYDNYSVVMYHPVTTELNILRENTRNLVNALIKSEKNYIIIHPNNDIGYKIILNEYERLRKYKNIKIFPSIRFEYFIDILKNADFLIGNSSAGIYEAPTIGIPSINIGTRQNGRFKYDSIIDVDYDENSIINAMENIENIEINKKTNYFGFGDSNIKFINILKNEDIWNVEKQKKFISFIGDQNV